MARAVAAADARRRGEIPVEAANPYGLELEDFSAAIREGRRPRLGREDAVGQARAIEMLYARRRVTGRLARILRALAVDADLLRRRRELRLLVVRAVDLAAGLDDHAGRDPGAASTTSRARPSRSACSAWRSSCRSWRSRWSGGALADAFDRRRLVMLAEAGAIADRRRPRGQRLLLEPVWFLYVAAALIAAFSAIRRPPLDAMLPRLVEREELKAASALNWASPTWRSWRGRRSAGVLIAWAGFGATYAVDLATFVVSLAALAADAHPAAARAPAARRQGDRRGPALRRVAPGAARHVPDRHGRDVLRDADGAVPGAGRELRRRRGGRAALRGAARPAPCCSWP